MFPISSSGRQVSLTASAGSPKVAIVISNPIQYFCPLYRALADASANLRVFFGSSAGHKAYFDPDYNVQVRWEMDLLGGYQSEFVAGADNVLSPLDPIPASDLTERLRRFDPAIVYVHGFYHPLCRTAFFWALRNRKRIVYWSDSENRRQRSRLSLLRKRLMLPPLFSVVDAFVTIGDWNEAYYMSYGVPRRKLFRSPCPIDSPAIERALAERAQHRTAIRQRFNVPEDALVAIAIVKLIARKRPRDLIEAAIALDRKPATRRVVVGLLGDGPDMAEIEKLATGGGRDCVRLSGFIGVEKLPSFFVGADLLLHPASVDPHPLVIGGAVAAGLPIIVSDRVGCVGPSDDVREGQNGIVYPCGDIAALERALRRIADDGALRSSMAAASLEIARHRTLEESVKGFLAAIAAVAPR
jgi:glycosyltransferase involved in cell wall biosynthesis